MTINELYEKCSELRDKGCGEFDVETLYKNISTVKSIDRECKRVTFA